MPKEKKIEKGIADYPEIEPTREEIASDKEIEETEKWVKKQELKEK